MAKSIGLRSEILITLTLLMGASLLLGGVLMVRLLEQSLLEQRIVQLNALTQTLSTAIAETHGRSGESIVSFSTRALEGVAEELQCSGWWLYNQELQLLKAQNDTHDMPGPRSRLVAGKLSRESSHTVTFPSLLNISSSPAKMEAVAPLLLHGRLVGLLEIHFSLDDIHSRLLFSQRFVFVYALLYGALLVLIGYYLLQRNVITPARNLLAATEDVGRGCLETRLPVAGPREIAGLAKAYNNMVAALLTSQQESQTHIRALEQTNQDLQQARNELVRSEKLASVGQLVAGLAHELGNPLAALIGYLEILKSRLTSADVEIVACALVESERIDFLVRELLDFSRPSEAVAEHIDPVKKLRETADLLTRQGAFGAVVLVDRLPESLGLVKINGSKFQQLFVNLFLNAIHACGDGGQIVVSGEKEEGAISLLIEDNGCGIEALNLEKIFDPFFTSKQPGEGTGLGLTVCHRIVEEADGQISVSSTPEAGTTFLIVLPLLPN